MTRIKDMDIDALARVVTAYEKELADMKQRQLIGGDCVRLFRVVKEFTVSANGDMLRRFRIKFTPNSGARSGVAFRIVVVRRRTGFQNEEVLMNLTAQFRRRKSGGGVQVWDNVTDLLSFGDASAQIKIYAFTTSDGELSIEYV